MDLLLPSLADTLLCRNLMCPWQSAQLLHNNARAMMTWTKFKYLFKTFLCIRKIFLFNVVVSQTLISFQILWICSNAFNESIFHFSLFLCFRTRNCSRFHWTLPLFINGNSSLRLRSS